MLVVAIRNHLRPLICEDANLSMLKFEKLRGCKTIHLYIFLTKKITCSGIFLILYILYKF